MLEVDVGILSLKQRLGLKAFPSPSLLPPPPFKPSEEIFEKPRLKLMNTLQGRRVKAQP